MPDFEDLDYYELFGVSRSASQEEIKRAYRQEISKYHPDRFANAAPEAREYASRRSQRITEAYSVLSDFAARSAYNRGQQAEARRNAPARRAPPPPVQPRDHQSELYEQAQEHFAAGRTLQSIAVLRQLQQLNPFYRDSAELLAAAEERMRMQQRRGGRGLPRRLLVLGGLVGGVALAALAAWVIGMRGDTTSATGSSGAATAIVALVATEPPTQPPEPTTASAQPTTASAQPTDVPAQPTATPVPPTDVPLQPTAAPLPPTDAPAQPTAVPVAEQGPRLFTDTFASAGWAEIGGNGWRVGYQRERYRIAVDPGIGAIWSYRTSPARDVSIGVDVQVTSGEGGLMLGFLDANNYLSFSTNPQQTSFRVEQHRAGSVTVLTGGQSEAIHIGADQPNRLVAQLRGDHLTLLINGQQLADLDVPGGLANGRYGLLAISGDTAAEAFFDNLEIRAIE